MSSSNRNIMDSFCDSLHPEHNVPLAEHIFMLEGRLGHTFIETRIHRRMAAAQAQYMNRLTVDWQQAIQSYQHLPREHTFVYCAASFAYAQVPVGKRFDRVFPAGQPHAGIQSPAIIVAVIHEWLPLPMPYIEAGHRSICLVGFPLGIPPVIEHLPEVERCVQTSPNGQVWLTSEETWQHLVQQQGDG
jgi:hypothetical protein